MPRTSEKYKTDYYFKNEKKTTPVVFIHGVGLTKEIWSQQTEFFKNHSILTYDLIGHGKTPLEKTQLNFQDFTKQLLNLINELEINKIHLVGFSLGALVARHFAAQHEDRLSSLVLHGSIYKRSNDQKRVVDVATAFQSGSDYIVVGRPIKNAKNVFVKRYVNGAKSII